MPNRPPGYTILEDGKLKPGLYKIQNLLRKTYLDIHEHSMELCCRPASALEENDGIWKVLPFGTGYTIRVERPEYTGKPDRFCTVKVGFGNGSPICVSPFAVAWDIKVAKDEIYKGSEYLRIFWGQKNTSWDLDEHGPGNGARVQLMEDERILPCRTWKFIPVGNIEGEEEPRPQTTTSAPTGSNNPPPLYEQETSCSCNHHDTESKGDDDGFGTTVVEVTTVTKTTRKKYRVAED